MAKKKTKSLRCPSCKTLILAKDPEFPFCSERCRTIDLGRWASGAYRVSAAISDPEVLESLMDDNGEPRNKPS